MYMGRQKNLSWHRIRPPMQENVDPGHRKDRKREPRHNKGMEEGQSVPLRDSCELKTQ